MSEPRWNCRECGRRWDGMAECHCAECHMHFLSVSGFDLHRRDFACLSPDALSKLGKNGKPRMVTTERHHGVVWVQSLKAAQEMPTEA